MVEPNPLKHFISYPFIAFPSQILEDNNGLNADELAMLLVLSLYARPSKGKVVVWPSVSTIAKRLDCSERHACAVLKRLVSKGYITRRRRLGTSSVTELSFIPSSEAFCPDMTMGHAAT